MAIQKAKKVVKKVVGFYKGKLKGVRDAREAKFDKMMVDNFGSVENYHKIHNQ
jgi:hypothetical protein